jgi:hypothetical protein
LSFRGRVRETALILRVIFPETKKAGFSSSIRTIPTYSDYLMQDIQIDGIYTYIDNIKLLKNACPPASTNPTHPSASGMTRSLSLASFVIARYSA